MRMKYCSRLLALLLAASLMAGDCIPVMATEQQAEVTEKSESGDTDENVAEAAEESLEADEGAVSEEESGNAEVTGEEAETDDVGDNFSESVEEPEVSEDPETADENRFEEAEESVTALESEEQASEDEVITQEESVEVSIPEANATVTVTDAEMITITVPSGYSGYGDTLTTLTFSESGTYYFEVSGFYEVGDYSEFYLWDTKSGASPYLGYGVTDQYVLRDDLYSMTKGRSYMVTGALAEDATEVTITAYKVELATPETFSLGDSVQKDADVAGYYSISGDAGDIYYLYAEGTDVTENIEFINVNSSFSIEDELFSATSDGAIYTLAYYGSGALEIFIPTGTSAMTLTASTELAGAKSLDAWTNGLTIAANTTEVYLFESEGIEDYYVSGAAGYDDASVDGLSFTVRSLNGLGITNLYYNNGSDIEYGFSSPSTKGWDVEAFEYAIILTNYSDQDVTVTLYTGDGITPTTVEQEQEITANSYNDGVYENYLYKLTQYYKFTATETGIYTLYHHVKTDYVDETSACQLPWMYRVYASGETTEIASNDEIDTGIAMEAGDSIIFRIDHYAYGESSPSANTYTMVKEEVDVTEGSGLSMECTDDESGFVNRNYYIFTPDCSGTLKTSSLYDTYYYDQDANAWTQWDSAGNGWRMDVDAGETCFFCSSATATLSVTKLFTVTAEQESYTLTYNYDTSAYDPISTYVYLTVNSEKNVPLSEVNWSATYAADSEESAEKIADFDPSDVVFSKAGTYTITAQYGSAKETLTIEVTAEEQKTTVALTSGIEKYIFKNVQKNVTKLSDITEELQEELLGEANLQTFKDEEGNIEGSFTYTNPSTGKTIATSTKLSSLPTTVKVTFTPEDTEKYVASSVEVKVVYANIALKRLEVSATKLAAYTEDEEDTQGDTTEGTQEESSEKTSSSGYPYTATISPIFSCGDQEYTAAQLESALQEIDAAIGLSASSSLESNKVYVETKRVLSDDDYPVVTDIYETVTGVAKGTAKVPYITNITSYDDETGKWTTFYSKTSYVTFTVVNDASQVASMDVTLIENVKLTEDEAGEEQETKEITVITENEGGTLRLLSDSKADRSYTVNLEATDYNGGTIENASVKWSTTSASIAKVMTAKDGTVTLTIPKNASGTATITVTSQDSQKVSTSFTVAVADTDVRLVTTSLTMNSYSEDYGKIYMYPNTLLALVAGDVTVTVQPVVKKGSEYVSYADAGKTCVLTFKGADEDTDTEVDADANAEVDAEAEVSDCVTLGESGYIEVQYDDANAANKTTSIILEITLDCGTYGTFIQHKTVKVTNKRSFPKTTVSVTQNYNSFWSESDTDDRNAFLSITTAGELADVSLDESTSKGYKISNPDDEVSGTQHAVELEWEETETVTKAGKATLALTISYDGYRAANTVKKTVSAVNTAPTFTVYGYDAWSPVFYTDLGEDKVQVLIAVPDQITSKEDITSLTSTSKAFTVDEYELVTENVTYPNKKGESVTLSKALLVTLKSETNKTASVKFTITSDKFTKNVTSKALTITAKKASSVKTTLYNTVTGSTASGYTLQQLQAGAEALTLGTSYTLGSAAGYYVECAGANASTRTQIANGNLVLTQSSNKKSYTVSASDTLFTKVSSCKLSFTTYVMSENGDGEYHPLKTVTLTLTLQKQKKAATPTLSLKASGSLNVVNPDSSVKITPTFKNRTQGSTISSVDFADSADAELYNLEYDEQTGVATLTKKADTLTIGKDSVSLVYRLRKTNGEVVKLSAKVTVSVVQTGAIKTSASSVTLYNASKGETYGKTLTVSVSKPAGATIAASEDGTEVTGLTVTGLEGSAVSYSCSPSDDGSSVEITFYMKADEENIAKSYKAKLTVTFAGASKAYTKTITVKVVK